ncbi:MAG: dihydropteroate synthase [Burkholderiales bacterium]|nr:dihydropteroate synthase [Burkholderiales bacterium]MDP2400139.1 dihydropteroate synthase [Burkholderiales bacterium]
MILHCGQYRLVLDRPLIMGVVNVTPDSFSDGGHFLQAQAAVDHARRLIEEGADLLDVGGESTRPGAAPVTLDEERRRVLPVIETLSGAGVPLSVDTQKPELMREAVAAGATLINDVNGFEAPGALAAVAGSDCAICIMHRQGDARTMQQAPQYSDVVAEVDAWLRQRAAAAEQSGIVRDRIVVDPGFGFGKTLEHNLALLRGLEVIAAAGYPVLTGLSRKSMIGALTGKPVGERVAGSVAAALLAAQRGAAILRVHDVAATRDALAVWSAVKSNKIKN